MKRTGLRLAVCIALILVCLGWIWGNSLLNSTQSKQVGQWAGEKINAVVPNVDLAGEKQDYMIVRKSAHILEFACLSFLLSWLTGMLTRKVWLRYALPFAGSVLAACIDEALQLSSLGRSPSLTDVGIDTLGTALGILLITLIVFVKTKIFGGKVK